MGPIEKQIAEKLDSAFGVSFIAFNSRKYKIILSIKKNFNFTFKTNAHKEIVNTSWKHAGKGENAKNSFYKNFLNKFRFNCRF